MRKPERQPAHGVAIGGGVEGGRDAGARKQGDRE